MASNQGKCKEMRRGRWPAMHIYGYQTAETGYPGLDEGQRQVNGEEKRGESTEMGRGRRDGWGSRGQAAHTQTEAGQRDRGEGRAEAEDREAGGEDRG